MNSQIFALKISYYDNTCSITSHIYIYILVVIYITNLSKKQKPYGLGLRFSNAWLGAIYLN